MLSDDSTHRGDVSSSVPETDAGKKPVRDYGRTVLITLLIALLLKVFVVEAFRIPSASMENTLLVGDFLIVNKIAYTLRTPRYVPFTNIPLPSITIPVLRDVRRGDIVVFEFPYQRSEQQRLEEGGEIMNFIKRCVGLPGDTVEVRRDEVFVNGKLLSLPKSAKDKSEPWFPARDLDIGSNFIRDHYGPLLVPQKGTVIELNQTTIRRWRRLLLQEGHVVHVDELGRVTLNGEPTDSYTVQEDYYFMLGDNRNNSLDSRYWGFVPKRNIIGEALFVYWSWHSEPSSTSEKIESIRWGRIGTIIR
jgi:signal peptidase I